MVEGYDFCGWASKNDLKCADGRIIRSGAFKVNDGTKVPLVWNHQHGDVSSVLGHALLENRPEGVWAYGFFNSTSSGQDAKEQVMHGDIDSLSIWANNLQQVGPEVLHGVIREVSLVLSGANPGAFIESVVAHSEPMEDGDFEAIFYTGEGICLEHAIQAKEEKEEIPKEEIKKEEPKVADTNEKTVQDVLDTMNEEQKAVTYALITEALESKGNEPKKEDEENEMKHNIFENDGADNNRYLSHSDIDSIFATAKKNGSLREAFNDIADGGTLVHSIDTTGMETATGTSDYGFNDPSMLFPEYRALSNTPEWISRRMDWVDKVLKNVHHTPFSRLKSVYANITEDEARAKGYIKSHEKKTEVFTTLKRTTDPTTIYKLQKMDRNDIVDITDFDVVAWIKAEMRIMLDEEIARAILIGDGRDADSEDKIPETNVRPIVTDVPLFNVTYVVNVAADADEGTIAKAEVNAAIRSRKNYKGSGNPTFFTTEDVLTEMLLMEDNLGHKLYKTEAELATALRVKEIVTVEPMEGYEVTYNNETLPLIGVIVNMADYNVGADKGGSVNMFDDFDINFNQYEYLIETRISGALIKPFSAVTLLLRQGQLSA